MEEDKPFFFISLTTPHFPLEAPDETIAKYEAKFEDGNGSPNLVMDGTTCGKKLARQKALGIVPQDQKLPRVHYFNNHRVMPGFQTGVNHNPLPYWDHLPESVQNEARFR